MSPELYKQIFRRKSFHKFNQTEPMTEADKTFLREAVDSLEPLMPGIKTAIRIVPATETGGTRGSEYYVMFYSEKAPNYQANIGYMGEQLDLRLVEYGLGTLWYGMGKTDEKSYEGLDFLIMMAVSRVPEGSFRADMYKSKRKSLAEIWSGPTLPCSDIVRFAPSACNSQPWTVEHEVAADGQHTLKVFRFRKKGFTGLIPMAFVAHYNRIDIGIFLCILELGLMNDGIIYERSMHIDDTGDDIALTLVAEYKF